jgi:hypothetical protein
LFFDDIANTVMPMTNDSVILSLIGDGYSRRLANASSNAYDIKFNEYDIDKALNMTLETTNTV